MSIRVLIVATWYPSDDDPIAGSFVEEQAVALLTRYEVAVIAPDLRGWRAIVGHGVGRSVRTETRRGIRVVRPRAMAIVPRSVHWGQAAAAYERAVATAFRQLSESWGRPDLIHAHVVHPGGWAAIRLARRERIPAVLTEHSSPFSMHLSSAVSRAHVQWALAKADALIAVGDSLRKQMLEVAPTRSGDIAVLGNVIDTAYFQPGGRSSESRRSTRLASIGALTPQKGIDALLRACALVRDRGLAFELQVGGDGPSRPALEGLSRELGLADRVRFLGQLSRDGVRDLLQGADVLVHPSRHETFGVVVAEAMACGLGVIVTRSGGPESFVAPGSGLIVPPDDVPAMADAITDLVTGHVVLDGPAAREEIVRRFSPEAFLDAIEPIYARLTGTVTVPPGRPGSSGRGSGDPARATSDRCIPGRRRPSGRSPDRAGHGPARDR